MYINVRECWAHKWERKSMALAGQPHYNASMLPPQHTLSQRQSSLFTFALAIPFNKTRQVIIKRLIKKRANYPYLPVIGLTT